MARQVNSTQAFQDKVIKLIPTEIVGAYMVLDGMVPPRFAKVGTLIVSVILLALTPVYLSKFSKVTNVRQLVVTSLSFIVWVYSLGGPFRAWGIQDPAIASIVLVLWTLIVPVFVSGEQDEQQGRMTAAPVH